MHGIDDLSRRQWGFSTTLYPEKIPKFPIMKKKAA
jgi:hypothetical protein